MIQAIQNYIREKQLFSKWDHLLIACSAGVDSMVLTQILSQIHDKAKLSLIHFDHGLRKGDESGKKDYACVQSLAKSLGIESVKCLGLETENYAKKNGLSTEMAGRALRHQELLKIAKEKGITKIVLAHHQDDSCESAFLQLFRGTKSQLRGISPVVEMEDGLSMIRPLLSCRKSEILAYAEKEGIPYREDETNNDTQFLRNHLRHDVFPVIETRFPDYREKLEGFLTYQEELRGYLDSAISKLGATVSETKDRYLFNAQKIKEEPAFLQRYFLQSMLRNILKDGYSELHIKALEEALLSQEYKEISLPREWMAEVDKQYLMIQKESVKTPSFSYELSKKELVGDFAHYIKETGQTINFIKGKGLLGISLKKLSEAPLVLRSIQKHDHFHYERGKREKPLMSLLKKQQYSKLQRQFMPVVVQDESIVMVGDFWIHPDYRDSGEEGSVLSLNIIQTCHSGKR